MSANVPGLRLLEELSLAPDELARRCDPEGFDFETTDDLDDPESIVGQERATRAVRFGVRMGRNGYNIFALGSEETDKRALIRKFLEREAEEVGPPPDLCYVNNFEAENRPTAFTLPAGTGRRLRADVEEFLDELKSALEAAFESEEYQTRRQALEEDAGQEQHRALEQLQEEARDRGLALLRTPAGFVFAPIREGDVLSPDEIEELPEEERERLEGAIEELQGELQQVLRQVPRHQREARERIRGLNEEIAHLTVEELLDPLRERYASFEAVRAHLDAVGEDVVENVGWILSEDDERDPRQAFSQITAGGEGGGGAARDPALRRYRINLLVDHGDDDRAPVVYEDHPTYQNLVGRVEHLPVMGALITDFNLIKAGALQRAHGGYLILDARRLLLQPFAWEGLKRALISGEVRIESPREALGMVSTVSLDPEPLEVDVKVVLLGSRLLYYLLAEHDPDFGDLFKVEADFDDRMERSEESELLYARLVASLARREELRAFDREAVARVVDRSARIVGDAEKLSSRTRRLTDLIREADFWAGEEGAEVVSASHVRRAVEEWTDRSGRIRDRVREAILRETIRIETEGQAMGQVNGLSVSRLGDFSFGQPNRITARVRLGRGEVIDIEREVELGGPIHSKGVLILSGFLGERYAAERPLALAASLVFEQSYGGIEGDSASCAELCALLSAIGRIPLRQEVAVTGSVDQHGGLQAIGGVNEKIEGFFAVCRARGLTGEQGVVIPMSNRKHLMLRDEVREAVAEGTFHVWAASRADEVMEILSGRPMGERDEEGSYPEGSVNRAVDERLAELAERRRALAGSEPGGEGA